MNNSAGVGEPRTPWRSGWLAFALGSVAWFGYGGPIGYVIPAALTGLALLLLTLRPKAPPPEWWLLVALAAWASVSMAWSPAAPASRPATYDEVEALTAVKLWLQLLLYGALVAGAAGVSPGGARRALQSMAAFVVLWGFLLLADGVSGGMAWTGITGLFGVATPPHLHEKKAAEGAYAFAVFAWPALAFLVRERRPVLAGATLLAATVGMAGLSAWSAALAVVVGGIALLVVARGGKRGRVAVGVLLALATLLTLPAVLVFGDVLSGVRDSLSASWAARIDIWRFAAERILENPVRGFGLDASRVQGPSVPLHPHNAALQLWLELGLPGVLLFSGLCALLGRRIGRLAYGHPEAARIAAASLAAYVTVGALSFGVWQEWWLATAALAATACIAFARAPAPPPDSGLTEIG